MPLSPDRPVPRVGVALGGGSARGYAHIGAIAALERNELAPRLIAGTSFGAVVGALYASGHSVERMTREATGLRRRDLLSRLADFGLHKAALFEGRKLESYFEQLTEGRHFSDLSRTLVVVATDVHSGQRVLLQTGSVARALRASTALPGVFSPVEIDGRLLADGGIGSPVPLDTLADFDLDLRIGIGAGMTVEESAGLQLARRALGTPLGRRVHRSLADSRGRHAVGWWGRALALAADGWANPPLVPEGLHVHTRPPISWLNFDRADAAIEAGEAAMTHFMPRLRSVVAELGAA